MAQTSAPCRGCGADIPRTNPTAPIRHYCTPDCRPRCDVPGCDKPKHGSLYCSAHHSRWKRLGDPLAPYERTGNVGLLCDVEGCDQPRRKRTWCASHYAQWYTTGEVRQFAYRWADRLACVVCGSVTGVERGRRKFCSARCQRYWHAHDGSVINVASCVICGVDIDLIAGDRRIRSDVRLCRRCRQDGRKHGVSVNWLAVRDGTTCGICQTDVDMTLRYPDPGTPSVDHIIPRALGGTNEPSNLQLAHVWCNQVKSDRL